jgi:arabinofuranosyltransferase
MKCLAKQKHATVCLLLIFAVVVAKTAWISDDAFITLRTVRNFVTGHGLTYNLGERVQTYTHPLWMFLLSIPYFFTREAYHTPIIASIVISLVAVQLIAARVATSQAAAVLGLVVLMLSKAFVDYSSSGLENPLTHLIIVVFSAVYLHRGSGPHRMFLLSSLGALATLNRMDTVLLVAPALVVAFFQEESAPRSNKIRRLGAAAAGFLPVAAWLCFSTIYYGFPFPNTAYAKLNTGVVRSDLAMQGLAYLANSLSMDLLTLSVIGAGLLAAAFKRTAKHLVIALGMLLYLIYTVVIGGDFMTGRFLTAPLVSAVTLICSSGYVTKTTLPPVLIIALLTGLASPHSPIYSGPKAGLDLQIPDLIDRNGIADERLFYHRATGWLTPNGVRRSPDLSWWAEEKRQYADQPVVFACAIGVNGYYAAPDAHIVDPCAALADPLLARLPVAHPKAWRAGHFERPIPQGYLETLRTGSNKISDPALAQFYDKLTLITQGDDLFATERLVTIWRMNTGQYDPLLEASWQISSDPETTG